MITKRFLFTLLSAWAVCMTAVATTEVNLKWGKPTEAELTMTEYEDDKDADALELYRSVDVNYHFLNNNFKVVSNVRRRLKILKADGKREADIAVKLRTSETDRDLREVLLGLKAYAYNMDDGKVTKTKMESSMVHEEQVDKTQKLVKFSIPQVRVGTVIEYEYRIESAYYYDLRDWYAQTNIPVLYTRYELSVPEWFKFNIEQTGIAHLQQELKRDMLNLGDSNVTTEKRIFTGERLPALKDDGFVWCAQDYGCRVTHELQGIYVPGFIHKDYTSTWDDVDKILLDDEDFGGCIKRSSPLKDDILAAGIPQMADAEQRAAAVWKLLKQRVRWNGNYAFWAKSAQKLLKEGTGSNADINFLYINMLHDAGMEAFPVVLRLRDQGHLPLTHASLKYLTTFVVGIQTNDSTISYMDGSVEDGYLNILPPRLLVERARTVRKGLPGQWVNLLAASGAHDNTIVQATISADGLVTGQRARRCTGQSAATLRQRWRTAKDSVEVIQEMQQDDGMEVSSYQLEGRHDFSPAVSETIAFTKQCDAAGDKLYLNPLVFAPLSDNPFKAETRTLPVEFPFTLRETISVQLTLPDGWQVETMPQSIMLKLQGITARIIGNSKDNTLSLRYQMDLDRTFFLPQEYADLKSLFDRLAESCRNVITLTKKP